MNKSNNGPTTNRATAWPAVSPPTPPTPRSTTCINAGINNKLHKSAIEVLRFYIKTDKGIFFIDKSKILRNNYKNDRKYVYLRLH